jgi:glutamate formiminotransferase/formiminotetrahydrofolate cyclodeaminase
MKRIIECVPNFSEGRNLDVIDAIVKAIYDQDVNVLNVDPGAATNRTVVTFVGSPENVVNAAFSGVKCAAELIDMRKHKGTHPRSGATDVLPLIPISGVTLEECAQMSRDLAKRIYDELGIPCYCYEAAASKPENRNLAHTRAGEYEALPEKLEDAERRPDFGPEHYNETVAKSGAINIGARDFLIAVNFNLNTTSTSIASSIALDVREKGRPAIENGKATMIPGTLKGCKAIGWYIDEYGIAQVSMNITDINRTPLHMAFEEVSRAASTRGVMVTGTEIIGLIPKRVLLEAGEYYMAKHNTLCTSEDEIIDIAVKAMGLDDLKPFNPREKVIEYLIKVE